MHTHKKERRQYARTMQELLCYFLLDACKFPQFESAHNTSARAESVKWLMNEAGNCAGSSAHSKSRLLTIHNLSKLQEVGCC